MQAETPDSRPSFRRVILLTTLAAFVAMAALWLLGTSGTWPRGASMGIVWVPAVVQLYFLHHWGRGRNLWQAIRYTLGERPPR